MVAPDRALVTSGRGLGCPSEEVSLSALILTLRVPPPSPLSRHPLSFALELRNAGPTALELPELTGWDLDVPGEVSHSSDSQGELWIRRVGEPEAGEQRYTCTDADFEPERLRLEPGQSLHAGLGSPQLPPGEYEARVRLYEPEVSSALLVFHV